MQLDRISVVIPTWDEAARVGGLLDALAAIPEVGERVVCDGGSGDGTAAVAAARGARVVVARRGRGPQLAAGAAAATGPILWFLHADARPTRDAAKRVLATLGEAGVVAGAFRTRTRLDDDAVDAGRPWFAPVLPLADLRSRYTRLPYGDQGLFCWAWAYRASGGYPDQPLLEDVELARRLRAVGGLRVVRDRLEVSARRWVAHPWRTALVMNTFPALYRLGVPSEVLAGWYGAPR